MASKCRRLNSAVDFSRRTLKWGGLKGREIRLDCPSLKRATVILVAPSLHGDLIGFHDSIFDNREGRIVNELC